MSLMPDPACLAERGDIRESNRAPWPKQVIDPSVPISALGVNVHQFSIPLSKKPMTRVSPKSILNLEL